MYNHEVKPNEIEITPEMIKAGLEVLRTENLDLSLSAAEDLVRGIISRTWKARFYGTVRACRPGFER